MTIPSPIQVIKEARELWTRTKNLLRLTVIDAVLNEVEHYYSPNLSLIETRTLRCEISERVHPERVGFLREGRGPVFIGPPKIGEEW